MKQIIRNLDARISLGRKKLVQAAESHVNAEPARPLYIDTNNIVFLNRAGFWLSARAGKPWSSREPSRINGRKATQF